VPGSLFRPGVPSVKGAYHLARRARFSRPRVARPFSFRARRGIIAFQSPAELRVPIVRGIFRYPIKGLSPQAVPWIHLDEGKPFPFDRVFALTRPGVRGETVEAQWAKKGLFLMLMLEEPLASVQSVLDVETMRLKVFRKNAPSPGAHPAEAWDGGVVTDDCLLDVDLGCDEGRRATAAFFFQRIPELKAVPRLVHAGDAHYMDKPESVISCINLETVRQLERAWGHPINPLRFRANFYIDGVPPWAEFDWVGRNVQLGGVTFRVDRRNGRCGSVNVDPVTGQRDLDIPTALRASYGHKDLGVYLVALQGGKVALGDAVQGPRLEVAQAPVPARPLAPPIGPAFICRGCYYIYDEAKGAPGLPSGTPFPSIAGDWRCPDCGTEKTNFRPYLAPAS